MKKLYLILLAAAVAAAAAFMSIMPAAFAANPDCLGGVGCEDSLFFAQQSTAAPKKDKDSKREKDGKGQKPTKDGTDERGGRDGRGRRHIAPMPEGGIQRLFVRLEKDKPPYMAVLFATPQKDSPYYKDVRVEIYQKDEKTPVAVIKPATDSGYGPVIFAGNFGEDKTQQIMLAMQSGGSGAFGYYYIYGFSDNKVQTLLDYNAFSQQNSYTAAYRDGYKVEVSCKTGDCKGKKFIIDISRRDSSYLEQIYNADGTLITPKQADVSVLNTVIPSFNSTTKTYDITILQRVTGLYNADLLGYVTTVQTLNNGKFETVYTTLQILPS